MGEEWDREEFATASTFFPEIENTEEDLGEMMNLILIWVKVIKLIGFNVGY